MTAYNFQTISQEFQLTGHLVKVQSYGNGHINDTFVATYRHSGRIRRYLHQRINQNVFKHPPSLMENIQRVTQHLRQKMTEMDMNNFHQQPLTLVPSKNNLPYYCDNAGNYWRTYVFIEKARSFDRIASPKQAHEVGRTFGSFQQLLVDLAGPRLFEVIPDFHNTPQRFATFQKAVERDAYNCAQSAKAEIEFALRQEPIVGIFVELQKQGKIPERIIHNDAKISNMLMDNKTGRGVCVIDLDTVMPGLTLYDFGDMIRSATCLVAEDERNLSKVNIEIPLFKALAHGYLGCTRTFLNQTEKDYLALAGKLITFETGVRFLTDYLCGNTYFKIGRQEQNLDRCRTQFTLVQSINEREDEMRRIIETIYQTDPQNHTPVA